MTKNTKAILIGLAVFVVCIGGAKVLFNTLALLSVFASFVIGAVVTAVLIARSRGERVEEVVEEVVAQVIEPESVTRPRTAKNKLMGFQERFVMMNPSEKLRTRVFNLTDNLLSVLEPINQRFSGAQITYEVTQMAIEHLPNRVLTYLKLSEEDRSSREENLSSDLDNMQGIIDKVSDVLKNADLNDDQREDLLSDIKYSSNL